MNSPVLKSKFFVFIATLPVVLLSCNSGNDREQKILPDTVVTDTMAVKEPAPDSLEMKDRKYNDLARFLAGMEQDSGSALSALDQKPESKSYRTSFTSTWIKLDTGRFKLMREFSEKEFADINNQTRTVFYPFSGPDFLNVYTFFPNGSDYYMLGLEPAGSLPIVSSEMSGDSLNKLFRSLNKSLHAILNYSFFRTLSMADDLNSQEIHGTLPLMMVFLARTGNMVLNVEDVTINNEGNVVPKSETTVTDSTAKRISGTRITFKNGKTGKRSSVSYFSADIIDQSLKNIPGFVRFTDNLPEVVTYLKSASYLMHKTYFSGIRTAILNHSAYILQDDSGIPLRFFADSTTWDLTLYGNYIRPIPLFAKWYQPDLLNAYSDKKNNNVKPLDFGIGYNFKSGSNLLLARKKKAA